MTALEIMKKITVELKFIYESTEDFMNWAPSNSNIEFKYDHTVYCLDYSIREARKVESALSTFRKKNKMWHKTAMDQDLKNFVETAFNLLLPLWYDEVRQREEEEEKALEEIRNDFQGIRKTYDSLEKQF